MLFGGATTAISNMYAATPPLPSEEGIPYIFLPGTQGQNLALTVSCVPYSLDKQRPEPQCRGSTHVRVSVGAHVRNSKWDMVQPSPARTSFDGHVCGMGAAPDLIWNVFRSKTFWQ